MRARDLLERLFWTFVAAFLGALIASPALVAVIDYSSSGDIYLNAAGAAFVSAAFAGCTAVANFVLLVARWRLSVLPNPGAGLPGLTIPDPAGE